MRLDLIKTARFESRGFPHKTTEVTGDIPTIMRQFVPWLKSTTMGTRIIFTIVRDPAELRDSKEVADLEALFDAEFGDVADEPSTQDSE